MISEQEILNASILIVDDQETNVQLLGEMLRDAGYTCIASTNDPYQVCALHQKDRYDLILLDLQMPGMDGFEVIEGLKEIEKDGYLPVLVITAQPGHKLRALAAGAKDFISKPFDLVEVQTRIHNMLEVRLLYKKLELHNQMLEQTVLERTAELRESEARFRRLTELSSDWYWEQDKAGHFTMIYGPVLEMLGIRVNDTLDETREDQAAQWNEVERKILEENIAARRPFLDFVYSRTKPDGSQQYLMVSGEPMFDPSGRFTGYRGIGKDVTDKMRSNDESPVNK
jgi:PAS domain S-box-containing protein